MMAAMGAEPRLRVMRLLLAAHPDGLVVGEIADELGIPGSTLSHHIKALVSVGLITQVRESTTLICHANYDVVRGLIDFMAAECCADEIECRSKKTAA